MRIPRVVVVVIVMVLLTGIFARAGKLKPDDQSDVLLCLEPSAVAPWTVTQAKRTASAIFDSIGVHLGWYRANSCKNVREDTIRIYFTDHRPAYEVTETLAWTRLGDHTHRIEVYCDRVAETVEPRLEATLLGHVIAHEVTHVLEGINRHSSDGLMKARWTHHDYFDMADHPLHIAPEDVALIRNWLDARALRIAKR